MISAQDIIDSINDIIVELYPTCTVYIQKVPKDFDRPSFFIQLVTGASTDANVSLTDENVIIEVVYFAPVDDFNIEDEINELAVSSTLRNTFKKGYLKVQDRALKITKLSSTPRDSEVYMSLQFEYLDSRYDDNDPDNPTNIENNTPLMNNIILKQGVD